MAGKRTLKQVLSMNGGINNLGDRKPMLSLSPHSHILHCSDWLWRMIGYPETGKIPQRGNNLRQAQS